MPHSFGNNIARTHQVGATMAEYAMLIAMIGVVGILGLRSLGGSTHNLLAGTGTGLAKNNTLSVLKSVAPSKSSQPGAALKGGGYYAFVTDPATGKMSLKLIDGSQGVATNVTSIDGNRNTLGSLMIANKLHQMAQEETDPELKSYYGRMAELSYYLGGAEGELDDVPELDQDASIYNNGQALRDVLQKSQELQFLMQNPPAGLTQGSEYAEVMPLAAEVYNIAQLYKNSLGQFIKPDGTVLSFGSKSANTSGNGSPGSALGAGELIPGMTPGGKDYNEIVSYDRMRQLADAVLSDNKVESAPVESTLTDATDVYEEATTP